MKKIIWILLFVIFLNITNATNNNTISLNWFKNIIPAYWWSYDLNKKLWELPKKSSIVIVNPWNWDFTKTQDVFIDEINNIQKNENLAIWYIYSKYWKRNINIIKQKIDNWLKYYPNINWIFVDEVSTHNYEFYKEIFDYVKSKDKNLIIILNPWTNPDESYINIADNIIIYENRCNQYNEYSLANWVSKYEKTKFSFLWHTCSNSDYSNIDNKYKNYISYFTEDWNDWNPWDSLSKFIKKDKYQKITNKIDSFLIKLKRKYSKDKYQNKLRIILKKVSKIEKYNKYKNNKLIKNILSILKDKIQKELVY